MRIPRWGPLGLIIGAPEEVWFFFRVAAYAFFIGTVYWFVSYEPTGTMLLYGFGIAGGATTIILARRAHEVGTGHEAGAVAAAAGRSEADLSANGPFGDERGRIPAPSYAPFMIGLGVGAMGLGLVFGPWLIGMGVLLFVVGGTDWLLAAGREYRSMEEPVERERERPRSGAGQPQGGGHPAGEP